MMICILHGAFHQGAVGLRLTAEDPGTVNQMAVSSASGGDILIRRSKYDLLNAFCPTVTPDYEKYHLNLFV